MATDRSRTAYQGLLIMDPRLQDTDCIWAAQSSYTQTGPKPDCPAVVSGTSQMSLQASGTISTGDTFEILAQRSGMPESGGGGLVWRHSGETRYRGWDAPSVITGWDAVEWTDGGVAEPIKSALYPHAVTLSDGTVLCAVQQLYNLVSNIYRVVVYKRNVTTGVWTAVTVHTSDTSPAYGYHPCLVVLPDDRVLCYWLSYDSTNDACQIAMAYTDDDGATWVQGSDGVLREPIDTASSPGPAATGGDPGRIRGAYMSGQVMLVVEYWLHNTSTDNLNSFLQYASDDLGCRFSTIGAAWDGDSATAEGSGRYHEIIVAGGKFQMYYLDNDHSSRPTRRWVGNAYDRLANATETIVLDHGTWGGAAGTTPDELLDGELACCVDDDGTVYLASRNANVASSDECIIAMSEDHGTTWSMIGKSDYTIGASVDTAKWWDSDDSVTYPRYLTITPQGGRLAVLHNWVASPGDEDASLGCIYLGGYSTVTMPHTGYPRTVDTQAAWILNWLPFDLPDATVWTAAGAGTAALAGGHVSISTTAAAKYYNSPTLSSTETEGLIVRFSLKINGSGGSLSVNEVAATIRLADGTNDRQVDIRFRSDGTDHSFRCRDTNAAANIGADVTVSGTDGIDIIVALQEDSFASFYRARSSMGDREYSVGPTTASLTNNTATPSASNLVRWGHIAVGTATSSWVEVHICRDQYTGSDVGDFANGQTNPDDLYPRNFSPEMMWIDSGMYLRAIDGPVLSDEEWSISPKYSYGIDKIFPALSPSPRQKWRSTGVTQQTLALNFNPELLGSSGAVESNLLNTVIGLTIVGSNWRTGTWQGYDVDTAAWVTIASIDASTGLTGLDYNRQGSSIVPATGVASDEPYLHYGECKDWIWSYDGTTFRRVTTNTEGKWDRSTSASKRPTLILDGVEAADPTGGTGGYLIPTTHTTVAYTAQKYAGYRLLIAAQSTPEGYFEIGDIVIGPVVVFGQPPDWARSVESEAGYELAETRDRSTRSRVAAPVRRTVEIGWSDGLDLSGVETGTPDYVLPTSTASVNPSASIDTSYQIEGLLNQLDGAHRHVVYLPRLPKGPADVIVCNRRRNQLYGRIVSPVRVDTVMGDEVSTEVVRIGSVAIREEV